MVRPTSEKTHVIRQFVNKYDSEVVINNKVVEPTNPIWKKIFDELPAISRPSNAKAIYTQTLKCHRQQIQSQCNESSISDMNVVSVMETTTDSNKTNDSSMEQQKHSMKFRVELSYKVWDTISPVKKEYRREKSSKTRTYAN